MVGHRAHSIHTNSSNMRESRRTTAIHFSSICNGWSFRKRSYISFVAA
jgi:hypothetical protein